MFGKSERDRELDAELQSHLQLHIEDNLRAGMSLGDARRRALLKLGGVEQTKESYRDRRGLPVLETTLEDIRFGVRLLLKTPWLTVVALLSLALGIGANTAIFSLIDTLLLRMLPVERPEQLVQVKFKSSRSPNLRGSFTNPIWEQIRDHQDAFSSVLGWSPRQFNLAAGGEAQYVRGLYVSGSYFTTLGVRPISGRLFRDADDQRGCGGAAVLGYGFWQQHYGGAQRALGSLLRLDGHSFQVVGVAPPPFFGAQVGDRFDVALPICAEAVIRGRDSLLDERSAWWLLVMGRLKPEATAELATARLRVLGPQIFGAAVPPNWDPASQDVFRKYTFAAIPAGTGLTGFSDLRGQYRRPLEILMVVAALVLLIACGNIASLLLARGATREREIAVRLSLGASRARLMRQVLTESLVLSGTGGLLGILFARWAGALLVRFVSTKQSQILLDLSIDGRVLSFASGIAILAGLFFGILPAFRATRVSIASAMKAGEVWDDKAYFRFRPQRWIVAMQVALSLVLLVGTGLFAQTFRNLTTLDPGFDRHNVLLVEINIHNANVPANTQLAFCAQVLDRLKSIPGVLSASQTFLIPLEGSEWNQDIEVEGYQPLAGQEALVWFNWITPGYFLTMRTPLLAGRNFDARDTASSAPVAIVNETFARQFFPHANPVGKYFRRAAPMRSTAHRPLEIIGVVKDSKFESLREDYLPFAYVSLSQAQALTGSNEFENSFFEIRTTMDSGALIPAVREAIARVNTSASLESRTLTQLVDDRLVQERLLATLSGFFGGLALLLTSLGLYGVLAYMVTQRTREIGIRIALGAPLGSILRLVMRDIAILLAAGVAAGVVAAVTITRVLQQLLFGLKADDPITLALAAGTLVLVALFASSVPARRAMCVDPMVALRYE